MGVIFDFLCCLHAKDIHIYQTTIDHNFHLYTISDHLMKQGLNNFTQEEENATNLLSESEENTTNTDLINSVQDEIHDNVFNQSLSGVTYAKISFPSYPKFKVPPEKNSDSNSNDSDHSSLINKSMAVPLHYLSVEDVRQRLQTLRSFQTVSTSNNTSTKTESISTTNSRIVSNYVDQDKTIQVSVERAQSPESHL